MGGGEGGGGKVTAMYHAALFSEMENGRVEWVIGEIIQQLLMSQPQALKCRSCDMHRITTLDTIESMGYITMATGCGWGGAMG